MFLAVPVRLSSSRPSDVVPVANGLLVVANVLAFWLGWSDYWAVGRGASPVTIFTYAFAHAGPWHLLANMWVLLVFGNPVNRRLGNGYYLLTYLGTAVALGMFAWLFCGGGLIGASGAIFAIIAVALMLMPAALIEVFYIALFPITILVGLLAKPQHWVFWFIRWDNFEMRAWWGLLLVPLLELWGFVWWGANWTNLGHLLGFFCGIAAVLLLPTEITMNRRVARA